MVTISKNTCSALANVISGGSNNSSFNLSPYRTGYDLMEFFRDLGYENETYGSDFGSRMSYTQRKLEELNGMDIMQEIIIASVDPQFYKVKDFDIKAAMDYLNLVLVYDGYRIVLDGIYPKLIGISDEETLASMDNQAVNTITVQPIFSLPENDKQFQCDIFVIMPFKAELEPIYEKIIEVGESLGKKVIRGDDFSSNHHIIDEIWFAMYNSNLVIADCTGSNPNVFYELGMAHTLGKPTIIITQSVDDTPFDVQSRRVIHYEESFDGAKKLERALKTAIQRILNL